MARSEKPKFRIKRQKARLSISHLHRRHLPWGGANANLGPRRRKTETAKRRNQSSKIQGDGSEK